MRPIFPARVLTLNFEGSTIRLLSARGEKIERWHALELPPELMSGGTVHQPAEVGAELRSSLNQLGIGAKRTVSAVSGQRSIYRTVRLPKMKQEYLDGAIRRKVRQEIALQPQETDLSWQVVDRSQDEILVYVVALPRDLVDRQVETVSEAGLNQKVLDVKPLALLHVVNQWEGLIANLEVHGLTIVVVRSGLPGVVRTVPLPNNSQNEEGRLDLLAQELQRTVKFFNESNKARPLPAGSTVYATGQDFDRTANLERLSSRLEYPVQPASPPLSLPDDLPLGAYAVNLGLVLKRA